jgi:hypothetical protein
VNPLNVVGARLRVAGTRGEKSPFVTAPKLSNPRLLVALPFALACARGEPKRSRNGPTGTKLPPSVWRIVTGQSHNRQGQSHGFLKRIRDGRQINGLALSPPRRYGTRNALIGLLLPASSIDPKQHLQ